MESGFKEREHAFKKLMERENNEANWEKLCCADKPLVPFMGAGTSAWCYPLWNRLLEDIVKETYSQKCAEIVKKALECSKKALKKDREGLKNGQDKEQGEVSQDAGEFPWMEEIAECIFNKEWKADDQGRQVEKIIEKFHMKDDEGKILRNLHNYVGEEWKGKKLEAEQALYRIFNPSMMKEKGARPEYQNYFPILFQDILVTTNYDKALEQCYPSILSYSYNDLNLGRKDGEEDEEKSWLFKAITEKLSQMNDKLRGIEPGLPGMTVPEIPMLLKVHGSIERASEMALTREGYNKAYCMELRLLLEEILKKSTVLFIGYSLSKDRITDELKALKKQDPKSASHFVFLPLTQKDDVRDLEDYGVYPIYYFPDALEGLVEDERQREAIFHDYCLGILFENLARRKKGYSQSSEMLWEKNRYSRQEAWENADETDPQSGGRIQEHRARLLKRQREEARRQMQEQHEKQYVHHEEAVQIWELLNSSGECPLVAITGDPGSGKSTLCESLRQLQEGCSNTMPFFFISLDHCKDWDEFCTRILEGMDIAQMNIPEMHQWQIFAEKIADKCCVYWRSVLILDHMDELRTDGGTKELWETIVKILTYWKNHRTRVVFTCREYPKGISCYTWHVGTLKKEEAERVFFDACTSDQGREVTYLERKAVGELFTRQKFPPSAINLLGRYANSKNNLAGLLEEWDLYHLPMDSGEQTVTRIIWKHLLREHGYENQTDRRKKDIEKNILWLWGLLGHYPGMFPRSFLNFFSGTSLMRVSRAQNYHGRRSSS